MEKTLKNITQVAVKQIKNVGVETAQLDVKILLKFVLNCSDIDLVLRADEILHDDDIERFNVLVAQRARHTPIAYLIGYKEFWGRNFSVTPATLIPRPESELFIETALAHFPQDKALSILDLGTGSGCLGVTLLCEFPHSHAVCVDQSVDALAVARLNADRLLCGNRFRGLRSNWCQGVTGTFDLIVANPPYIEKGASLMPDVGNFEPKTALFAGDDGIDAYRVLIPQLKRHTHQDSLILIEIGQGQEDKVALLLNSSNIRVFDVKRDLNGIQRLIVAGS